MSVLKLSKNDIIRNEDKGEKIKLKRSDLSFDSSRVSTWEQTNKQSLDILNDYNNKINNSEWLSEDDRAKYRSALDSYIETANLLRGINKTFGEGYSDEDEKSWLDSVSSMNKGYDEISGFYNQFASDKVYSDWLTQNEADEAYNAYFSNIDADKASKGWEKYLADVEAEKLADITDFNFDGKEDWWETLLGYLGNGGGGVVDTTLPMAGTTQTIHDLRADVSYRRPNDDWSEEQKNVFGNLYATSPELAYNFAEETNQRNNKAKEEADVKAIQESATSNFGAGLGHTIGAIATAPFGLADYLGDLAYATAGRDIAPDGNVSPFEYSQAVTGGISTYLNDKGGTLNADIPIIGGMGWGEVYGLGTSVAQSLASAYTLGGGGTLVSYFGQGAASAMRDAMTRGVDEGRAALYGATIGAIEGIAEMMGIDNLFKLGSASTFMGVAKNILKQAGAEGAEEGLTAILSNIADAFIMQDKSNFAYQLAAYKNEGLSDSDAKWKVFWDSIEGIAFDTIAGAASGAVSGGVHTGVQYAGNAVGNVKQGAEMKKNFGTEIGPALTTEALEIDPNNSFAQKMQGRINNGKNLSAYQVGKLVQQNEQAIVSQDKSKMKSAVEARLTELGERGDISTLADVIVKAQSGEELTRSERTMLTSSTYGRRVSTELNPQSIESGGYTSKWAEGIGTERINSEAYNRSLPTSSEVSTGQADITSATVNTPAIKNATGAKFEASEGVENQSVAMESSYKTSEDGKTRIGDLEVSIKEVASVKNGEVTLRLEDGSTVSASDVEFSSSDEGLLYENVAHMGLNAATANAFINNYDGTIPVAEYAIDFRQAYRYGELGIPSGVMNSSGYTSSLSEAQKSLAYDLGKTDAKYRVSEKQAKIDSEKAKVTGKASKKGKVYFDGSVVGNNLTEIQRASLKGLKVVAEAMGVDIHIFESPVGKDGKRQGENGRYDPVKKVIYLDLHAGIDGNGLMLFTASHELTHHIREVAPTKFKAFADALLEEYTKNGKSVDALIKAKLEHLERNGRLEGKTDAEAYDLAYEEVVADAAESMLVDSDAIEALSKKLQAKDKGLWETIKDFIAKLVARIKEAYKGLDPDSAEGQLVREMKDSAERLQKLWVDALLEASEADRVLAENGIMVDAKKNFASLYSVRDVLNSEQQEKVSKALAERFDVTQDEAKEWLRAETSLASLILNPKYSQYLDYTADPDEVAIKTNSDYPQGTVDFSNNCPKRRDFTEVMNRVLRNFPNHVFTATDLAKVRTIMEQEGMEVACHICYVEDRRQLDGPVAQDFIDSLKIYREGGKTRPDGKPFNANQLKAFSLIEGDTYTPSIYELVSLEGRNSLKAKNPAMEEAWVKFNNARGMQSVRLLLNDAEYKRQILKYSPSVVARKNDYGGLRIYSFSDMEMFHLIDIIQVITDSATVGLSLQGYTKVNEYAKAVKDTGEKLNRSLIPKGDLGYHMENGRVVLDFDTVEGIDINHSDFFDNIDNPNIGNIVIGINATQIKAAMASKFIDQIIPFHTGQSSEVLGEKGISTWENYRDYQSERDVKTQKKSSHQINIYTEVINAAEAEGKPIKNKVDFVNKFLEVCKENNLIPRFSEFLNVDENGNYVYTEGYHKFLVDFKTFDQTTGEYLPQMPVKPFFDNEYLTKLLRDYVKSQKVKDAALAKAMPKVIDRITKEIVKPEGAKYSDRDSHDNKLSKDQAKFFKDSKARDEDGNLLVLYHGTGARQRIAEFRTIGGASTGLWLTTDHETAVWFTGAGDDAMLFTKENSSIDNGEVGVYELYANVKKPLVVDARGKLYREIPRPSVMGKGGPVSGEEICIFALENGYDGVILKHITEGSNRLGTDVIVFSSNQVKYTDNLNPTEGNDIRYQDRNPDSYSNRSLLAGALETTTQNDIEREKLQQYKAKIDLINSEEQKLRSLREQIKELSFKKGPRDTKAIKQLQFEANQTANRINTYDKQLLSLESTKALKGVLEREKALARKRDAKKYKEAIDKYREKSANTQRELMDRYQESRKRGVENRNKTAMRYKIKGIVSELNTLLLKPTAKKHIKEELRKEVADALSAINMDTVGADERVAMYNDLIAKEKNPDVIAELMKTRDRIQLQGDNLQEKLNNLQSAYEKIKNTDDIELNLAYQEVIHNSIKAVSEKIGKTSIRNMSLEQLEMVYDLFSMIRHTIRDANKSFKEKKGQTIMQMAEAVNDQVRTVGGQPYKRNAINASLQRIGWTFLKPYVAFRTIGSVTLTNMYKELRNGEDTFYNDVKEAQAFIEEQYKKHGYKSWDMEKTKTFTAKSGKSFDLTLEQMMTLYAYSKRDQAHKHIIEGGIVFEDALIVEKNKAGIPIKYEVTTKDAFNLSEETFTEIANSLTKEQKAFVDAMQRYLSVTMGAKGNEVSMELLGVKLFKEEFYLPIKSSQYYMNFKAEEAGEVKLKSPAFSKETVTHANNPIVLHSFTDLWAEHINDMSMYHSFVLALEDFTRVYNYKTKTDAKVETMDTKATLETAYPGVTNYISKFLKDMNGGVRAETVGWAEKLTSLSKKGAVLGSASVTIQQPSAVMRAMAYINPKYFVTTAPQSLNLVKHKQDFEELKKYAPIAGIKEMGRFDVGMGQGTVDWIQSNKTVLEKAEDILSLPPAFMDEITWVSIWNAVKRETLHNNKNLSPKSEEFLKLAGERITEVISLSQVYDSVFSRSDLMRNKSWIAKALTAFMAEPSTTLNMIWDSWVQAKRQGTVKGYAKATATTGGAIVAATILNSALKSIVLALRDDDEDEAYIEKYLEAFVGDLKDSLNPLSLIPFVKDVVSIFNGYDVERMDMALFSDLKKAIDAMSSDSKTEYEKWSGLIGAISAFFGVPVKNVERDVRSLINTVFGKTEAPTIAGMINAIKEGWTGKEISNGQQLYEAMVNGDSAQIKRIEGRFEDQKDIDAALRKALRENDSRIREAAEAYLNGDYDTYNKLREKIIAEGNFSRQIVIDSLKAEYNYLKKKAKEDK